MASQFITQTTDDQPTILLIGTFDQLIFPLQKILEKNGLNVEIVKGVEELITPKDWYKIIWVPNLLAENDSNIEKTSFWLKTHHRSVMVFTLVFTSPEAVKIPIFKSIVDANELFQKRLNKLLAFPFTFCLGLDVLADQISHPFFDFQTTQLPQGKLVDPRIVFYFQKLSQFLSNSSVFLISPWNKEQKIFSGKAIFSKQVVAEIQRLYFQYFQIDLEIEIISVPEQIEWKNFEINKDINQEKDPQLIAIMVKNFPKIRSLVEKVSEQKIDKKGELQKPAKNVKKEEGFRLKQLPKIKISSQSFPQYEEKKDLADGEIDVDVAKIFDDRQVTHKTKRVEKLANQSRKFIKKSKRKVIAFWGGIICLGAGVSISILIIIFVFTSYLLKQELNKYLQDVSSQDNLHKLERISQVVATQTSAYSKFLGTGWFEQQLSLTEIINKNIKINQTITKVDGLTQLFVSNLLGSESGDTFLSAQAAANQAQQAYKELSLLQTDLEEVAQANVVDAQAINQLKKQVQEKRKSMASLQQFQPLLASILGQSQKKTYALVVQDNQELRPTGGFIHTIILVTIENGMIIDHQAYSSYQLDKLLSGQVPAPAEVKQYLGESNLYLRDANWDPDFTTSAAQISWFIKKTTNRPIDGVIAMNLYLIRDLIKAIGPLDLPEYNEVLTDKNIQERMEFHSEVKLDDNAKESDYLTVVMTKLVNNLLILPKDKILPVIKALNQNLTRGELLINLADNTENRSLASLGWTGEILSPTCPAQFSENCLIDTFMKVEANVGINKANYALKREYKDKVTISQDSISHHRQMTFTNNSKSQAWPQGNYKSYLRFYVPSTTILDEILISNQTVPANRISQQLDHGKKIIGVYLDVPIMSNVPVELKYHLPLTNQIKSYSFFDQKQPGIEDETGTITLIYEPVRKPVVIAPQAEIVGDSIIFALDHNKHNFIGVEFDK